MQQQANVSTPSPAIAELEAKRQLIRAIQGGSEKMRTAKYLPKYPAEEQPDYQARCENTILDNFVEPAIVKASGKLFSKPIKVEDLPTEIKSLVENIDRQGRALDPFIMDVGKQAFEDGISYVMVDMPPSDLPFNASQREEKKLGIRPYAIHIKSENLLEALSEMIGGVDTLTRVRIMECVSVPEPNGWGYTNIEQVRVWYRDEANGQTVVRWETWRENKDKKEWYLFEEGVTSFKSIYLVPFYTNRTGFMLGEPGFNDIAEKNLEHFRLKSGYWTALEMCNFGMYWATGVDETFQLKVGPMKALVSSNPDAEFGIMETTGKAVELSLSAIQAVESRIESTGVNLRVENAGRVSATAAALDSEDTNASLKAIAKGFSDSIEQLFGYFGEMMNIDANQAEAHVNDDMGQRHGTDAGLQEITKGRALGDISREGWLDVLRWRGELPESFDPEEDAERLSSEGPPLGSVTTTPAQADTEDTED